MLFGIGNNAADQTLALAVNDIMQLNRVVAAAQPGNVAEEEQTLDRTESETDYSEVKCDEVIDMLYPKAVIAMDFIFRLPNKLISMALLILFITATLMSGDFYSDNLALVYAVNAFRKSKVVQKVVPIISLVMVPIVSTILVADELGLPKDKSSNSKQCGRSSNSTGAGGKAADDVNDRDATVTAKNSQCGKIYLADASINAGIIVDYYTNGYMLKLMNWVLLTLYSIHRHLEHEKDPKLVPTVLKVFSLNLLMNVVMQKALPPKRDTINASLLWIAAVLCMLVIYDASSLMEVLKVMVISTIMVKQSTRSLMGSEMTRVVWTYYISNIVRMCGMAGFLTGMPTTQADVLIYALIVYDMLRSAARTKGRAGACSGVVYRRAHFSTGCLGNGIFPTQIVNDLTAEPGYYHIDEERVLKRIGKHSKVVVNGEAQEERRPRPYVLPELLMAAKYSDERKTS